MPVDHQLLNRLNHSPISAKVSERMQQRHHKGDNEENIEEFFGCDKVCVKYGGKSVDKTPFVDPGNDKRAKQRWQNNTFAKNHGQNDDQCKNTI